MRERTIIILLFMIGGAAGWAAERIVSLSPALTELVYQLGAGEQLVGRSDACNYPSEVMKLPVAGRFADPDVEKVLRLRPTLLISNDLVKPGIRKALERSGVRCEVRQCSTMEAYLEWVTRLGELLGRTEQAQAERLRVERRMASVRHLPAGKRVLWVVWDSPLMVAGDGSLADGLLRSIGAENAGGEQKQPYYQGSYDWLLAHQPDAVVWTAKERKNLERHVFWGKLTAVRQHRVIMIPDHDLVQRPGPRWCDGMDMIYEKLKDLFKEGE